jgi:hypothetical protein
MVYISHWRICHVIHDVIWNMSKEREVRGIIQSYSGKRYSTPQEKLAHRH